MDAVARPESTGTQDGSEAVFAFDDELWFPLLHNRHPLDRHHWKTHPLSVEDCALRQAAPGRGISQPPVGVGWCAGTAIF